MKKIYSLLLLGGLLLLGAQNVLATDYYIGHNGYLSGSNSWGGWGTEDIKMAYAEDGYYVRVFMTPITGEVRFKVVKDNSDWLPATAANYSIETSDYTVTMVNSDYLKFDIPATPQAVAIFYNPETKKLKVKNAEFCDATIVLTSSTNLKLHAWDDFGYSKYVADSWPGALFDGESAPYSRTISFPKYATMTVIFSKDGDDTKKTANIVVGKVNTATTFSFNVNANWSYSCPSYLRGTFNSWGGNDEFSAGSVTVALAANSSYEFKEVNDNKWTGGAGSPEIKVTNPSVTLASQGTGNNIKIYTTIAGDYTFTLGSEIEVTYPTSISRGVAIGSYGTICLPVNATISGANLYTLTTVGASSVTITPTGSNALTAGIPYIFKATDNTQTITLLNTTYAEEPEDKASTNGLQGVYAGQNIETGKYILYGDKICKAGTGVTIGDNRAYFDITVPTNAPSAFRIVEGDNNTTNINAIDASEDAVKFFQNGKLFIKKNGVVYDMMGTIVK